MPGIEVGGAGVGVNPQNIADSPAYKFRFGQGQQAIERRAGANGTLLTGGTLKDLTEFGQGLASTEYGNEWQRQFGLAGLNADISAGNAGRNLSGLLGLTGYGMDAANGMGKAYAGYGTAGAQGTYGQASAVNSGIEGIGNTLQDYFAKRRNQAGATGGAATGGPAPLWNPPGGIYDSLKNWSGQG